MAASKSTKSVLTTGTVTCLHLQEAETAAQADWVISYKQTCHSATSVLVANSKCDCDAIVVNNSAKNLHHYLTADAVAGLCSGPANLCAWWRCERHRSAGIAAGEVMTVTGAEGLGRQAN